MNFGRLLARVPDDTLVIFLTDNGPGGVRWNAGLRNRKGTVYDGGIRVPFFIRWKGQIPAGRKEDTPAAHIDVMPTVLAFCGVPAPKGVQVDGRSILPPLRGPAEWPDRHLFFQWHRGDVPEPGRAFAVRGPRYKLVQAAGVQVGKYTPKVELFDLVNDPFEEKDLAAAEPDRVKELRARYDEWFADVKATRNFAGPRIHLGSEKEGLTVLTRQDWRGPKAGWAPTSEGHWDVFVERAGTYKVTLDFEAAKEGRRAVVVAGRTTSRADVAADRTRVVLQVPMEQGGAKLEASIEGKERVGVRYVEVQRIAD
jgi:arylsulfatase A-like enzyme